MFTLFFLREMGHPPSDFANFAILLGSVPYAIGAPTLGIFLIKNAGQSRIRCVTGSLALLTGLLPLAWLGIIAFDILFG